MHSSRALLLTAGVITFILLFLSSAIARANHAEVRRLRVQQVGEMTYFHARFDTPTDMKVPSIQPGKYGESERRRLALTPQLVPHDSMASAVYQRLELQHFRP